MVASQFCPFNNTNNLNNSCRKKVAQNKKVKPYLKMLRTAVRAYSQQAFQLKMHGIIK